MLHYIMCLCGALRVHVCVRVLGTPSGAMNLQVYYTTGGGIFLLLLLLTLRRDREEDETFLLCEQKRKIILK